MERIAFEEAIGEDLLFKRSFAKLSPPQATILKVIYGQPLSKDELYYWSAFSGAGVYDELGFLTSITHDIPYTPREYADITLICGRRGGKTSAISAFVIAYEALLGGHRQFVGAKQLPVYLQVCQDLTTARANLRQFIFEWLDSSPVGKKELEYYGKSAITADDIRLKHALITVGPPTIKLRSQAIACCAMDELCVWPKDREASNPDHEVQRAVEPALLQFYPFDKIIKTSTPMTEEGLLWQAKQTGTRGRLLANADDRAAQSRTLVLEAPTAALMNPALKNARVFLAEKRQKDPEAFPREYLAQFAKSVSGFLSPELLRMTVTPGLRHRPPEAGQYYVATLDPAFRRDAFGFTIGHMHGTTFVQDYIQSWRGTKESPLRPGAVLDAVNAIAMQYGVRVITSDQYHSESLMELALARGMIIEPCPLTLEIKSKMWGDFNSLLMQGKLRLLDHSDLLDELMKMERTITKFGNVQYAGQHRDDLAMVTALCCHKAMQMGAPRVTLRANNQTNAQDVRARVQRRVRAGIEGQGEGSWWAQ